MEMKILVVFECQRCRAINQQPGSCGCGYPLHTTKKVSSTKYCEIFGHVKNSLIIEHGKTNIVMKKNNECLCCGEKLTYNDDIMETVDCCGNCKKEESQPEDWRDDCLKY
ncbi:MAG: hypothetical protein AAB397_02080 [Patescibacteria group bacterium]